MLKIDSSTAGPFWGRRKHVTMASVRECEHWHTAAHGRAAVSEFALPRAPLHQDRVLLSQTRLRLTMCPSQTYTRLFTATFSATECRALISEIAKRAFAFLCQLMPALYRTLDTSCSNCHTNYA
jgi:hypothetical protein